MASNRFGTLFTFTTWGESHGSAIGVVIDGCPAGVSLEEQMINAALARRAPGKSPYTTPRKENDTARIVSGVLDGITTGAPISIIIDNADADSSKYDAVKHLLRPGHANFTYLHKYGIFDHKGGGRASARETACRVAAGAVARQLLQLAGISVIGYLEAVGSVTAHIPDDTGQLWQATQQSPLFTPDLEAEQHMGKAILEAKKRDDSLGGIVGFRAEGVPPGLGDPVYGKISSSLAAAMMSIPAAKGFEMGRGFGAAAMSGSEHNDLFVAENGAIRTTTNNAGGCLGGITTGMPLYGRVAFKPTPSILQPMRTVDTQGNTATFALPAGSRHDPCVAVRAVPVVEAMCMAVLADALLLQRSSQAQGNQQR